MSDTRFATETMTCCGPKPTFLPAFLWALLARFPVHPIENCHPTIDINASLLAGGLEEVGNCNFGLPTELARADYGRWRRLTFGEDQSPFHWRTVHTSPRLLTTSSPATFCTYSSMCRAHTLPLHAVRKDFQSARTSLLVVLSFSALGFSLPLRLFFGLSPRMSALSLLYYHSIIASAVTNLVWSMSLDIASCRRPVSSSTPQQ